MQRYESHFGGVVIYQLSTASHFYAPPSGGFFSPIKRIDMPDKNAASTIAHLSIPVPVGVVGIHLCGIPLSDWAYIAAIVSAVFCVASYSVKMWRDWHIGRAAQRENSMIYVNDGSDE